MENDFFNSESGSDPVLFQHLLWYFGHPEVWVTLLLWAALLLAVFKIAKRLWRLKKRAWFALFMITVTAALAYYSWLSMQAFGLYEEGRGAELVMLPHAKRIFLILSVLSTGWIIIDWMKARRSS